MGYIVGIDGGGTITRVLIVDINNNEIFSKKFHGCANYKKDFNAKYNVQNALEESLMKSNLTINDIDILVAGLAGYDSFEEYSIYRDYFDYPELVDKVIILNDARIAHEANLYGSAGICVIVGTGSICYGINENSEVIRNTDFGHYSYSGARFMVYHYVEQVKKLGITTIILSEILKELCMTRDEFYNWIEIEDKILVDKRMSEFSYLLSLYYDEFADIAFDRSINYILEGLELLKKSFINYPINIVLQGSIINSKIYKEKFLNLLNTDDFVVLDNHRDSEYGAVDLGIKHLQ